MAVTTPTPPQFRSFAVAAGQDLWQLRPEYDLANLKGGVRGKYAERFRAGTNLVLLSPDVAGYFPDERSVNAALRSLICIAKAKLRRVA